MHTKLTPNHKGFTILELMIATAISSGAILLLMFGFLAMSDSYTKGLTVSQTQNTTRDVINTISQSIQFGDPTTISWTIPMVSAQSASTSGWFCADNNIFAYTLGQAVTANSTHTTGNDALIEQTGTCPPPSGTYSANNRPYPGKSEQELLGPNMSLAAFSVAMGADNTYLINIHIVFGSSTVLQGVTQSNGGVLYYDIGSNQVKCSGQAGQDFCASSDLQTVVVPRIAN